MKRLREEFTRSAKRRNYWPYLIGLSFLRNQGIDDYSDEKMSTFFGKNNKWKKQIICSKFEILLALGKKKQTYIYIYIKYIKDRAMKTLGVPRNQNTYMKKARRNILWSWHTMEVYWFKSDELYAVPGHLLLNKFNVREQVKEAWNSEAVYIRFSARCYKWREMFI